MTSTNVRFFVDHRDMIIDRLNNGNSGLIRVCDNRPFSKSPDDENYLRDELLHHNLLVACGDLFLPFRAYDEEDYNSIVWALFLLIKASRLNTLPVGCPSARGIERHKPELQSVNSLGLFIDKLEGLLLDLFGELEADELVPVLDAVEASVEVILKHVRSELWHENNACRLLDCVIVDNLMTKISGDDLRSARKAFWHLQRHACSVRDNPHDFGAYTHQFIAWLDEHWAELAKPIQ